MTVHRPFIFISYGVTTAPLAPLLARRFTLVVPHSGVAEQLRGQGILAIGWGALADAARVASLPRVAERMGAHWCTTLRNQAYRLHQFSGSCRGNEVVSALQQVFHKHLARQMAAIEFARSLCSTDRFAAVVVHEDATGDIRAFLETTRRFGVPSIHVPHGVTFEARMVGGDVHGSAHTDIIAAAGPAQRDWYLRRGVAPEQIIMTGNPAWDHLCTGSRLASSSLGLPAGPVVTVATSWVSADNIHHALSSREHDRRTRVAFEALARLRSTGLVFSLVLKLHPSAPPGEADRLQRLASEIGVSIDLVARDRLPQILRASDLLVALPSTIAVEALLVGTPVIVPESPYEGDAVLSPPATPEAVASTAQEVLSGLASTAEFAARRRDFLERYNGRSDGRAAARIAALIDEICSRAMAVRQSNVAPRGALGSETSREGPRSELHARLELVRTLARAGNHESGLFLLDEGRSALESEELEDEILMLRGELLGQLGRIGEAERCFRSAIDAGAGARAHEGLGTVLLERGRRTEAGLHLREATRLDPQSDSAWCGLGVLAGLSGDRREAVVLLEQALAINPGNGDARRALDVMQAEEGRGDEGSASRSTANEYS